MAYVYLCYGIHNMLNIVTGPSESPQAVLIRSVEDSVGPGRLTKALSIGPSFNGISFIDSDLIWLETDTSVPARLKALPRVGISYASEEDRQRLWRFVPDNNN